MTITSALYSGVTGLNTSSTSMEVIGNNLANSGTVGYKSARTVFADMLSANVTGTAGDSQVGRGAGLSTTENIFTQGGFEDTSSDTDLAIEGDSFFTLVDEITGDTYYTRDGSFSFSDAGELVNGAGLAVQGRQFDDNGNLLAVIDSIQVDAGDTSPAQVTETMEFKFNLDAGEEELGGSASDIDPRDADTYNYSTPNTIYDSLGEAHSITIYYRLIDEGSNTWETAYTLDSGTMEPSSGGINVGGISAAESAGTAATNAGAAATAASTDVTTAASDPNTPAASGTAATDANTAVVDIVAATAAITAAADDIATAYENGTTPTSAELTAAQTALTDAETALTDAETALAAAEAVVSGGGLTADEMAAAEAVVDAIQDVVTAAKAAVYAGTDAVASVDQDAEYWVASLNDGTTDDVLEFDENGSPIFPDEANGDYGGFDPSITLPDWGNGSERNTTLAISLIEASQHDSNSILLAKDQNGYASGRVTDVKIDNEGVVTAYYSNDTTKDIAQLVLSKFQNVGGLEMAGTNQYIATSSVGDITTDIPSDEMGSIKTKALEQSTVDIAMEFVKMITTQRGYQANSKTISTVDEMLTEIINLKR